MGWFGENDILRSLFVTHPGCHNELERTFGVVQMSSTSRAKCDTSWPSCSTVPPSTVRDEVRIVLDGRDLAHYRCQVGKWTT